MEYINPIDSIKINEHILIAKECWPEHFGREIEDINIIKQFYNDSYNLFHEKILTTLNKYHPATWIRIAYIQLEIWTLNFYKARHEDKNFQEVPFLFIPIARYGWRYIIENSLEINPEEFFNYVMITLKSIRIEGEVETLVNDTPSERGDLSNEKSQSENMMNDH